MNLVTPFPNRGRYKHQWKSFWICALFFNFGVAITLMWNIKINSFAYIWLFYFVPESSINAKVYCVESVLYLSSWVRHHSVKPKTQIIFIQIWLIYFLLRAVIGIKETWVKIALTIFKLEFVCYMRKHKQSILKFSYAISHQRHNQRKKN